MPLADLRVAMSSLLMSHQPAARVALLERILEPLAEFDRSMQPQFASSYSRSLVRGYCQRDSSTLIRNSIERHPELSLAVMKALRVALQEDQRCIAIKALAGF